MDTAREIAKRVKSAGGCAYYVGGCVRDALMGIECEDIDIEVHGIGPEKLEEILNSIGKTITIGKSFGIFNLNGIDISMPRRESAVGSGHRDFDVIVDPFLGTGGAAKRRDFTVNSIMQNVLTGEITDCYGGMADIENKIIRHVNSGSFVEDPLRVLRAAQFSARLGFKIDEATIELCKSMDLSTLSRERVFAEMKKALLLAEKPSVFFSRLREMEQLDFWFPELKLLIGLEQNPKYHREGDVWIHTMMVLDAAAGLSGTVQRLPFLISALVHDFGKIVCTEKINGVIHAYRHESEGKELIEQFLRRITNEKKLISYAVNMAMLHMKPNILAHAKSAVKTTNRMFDESAEPLDLILLSAADHYGQLTEGQYDGGEEQFLRERYEIYKEYMSRPYVTGSDLIAVGLTPDEKFSEILAYAHKLRLAGIEKNSALKQTLAYYRKMA